MFISKYYLNRGTSTQIILEKKYIHLFTHNINNYNLKFPIKTNNNKKKQKTKTKYY